MLRVCFGVTVAILAAALADPLLELASNSGLFGSGHFTDQSNLDILPALIVGVLLMLLTVLQRTRAQLVSREMKAVRDAIASPLVARLLPMIFVVQLAFLYGMETIEQFLVYGHVLGGTLWLGAPTAISLLVHALFCILTCVAVARSVRALAKAAANVVRFIRACVTMLVRDAIIFLDTIDEFAAPHRPAPIACRIGMRAPPFSLR